MIPDERNELLRDAERRQPEFDDKIHLLGSLHPMSLSAACGAMMQPSDEGWSNEVNYWGRTGIRIERPFTTLTLDPSKVTCRRKGCRQ